MYHQLSWRSDYDKVRTIDEHNEQVKKDQEKLEKFVLDNTKITKDQLEHINERKQDWWMDAKEALKLGVIDEIIKPRKNTKR
jgi:ATP-dependent protease ClpP protease subunit